MRGIISNQGLFQRKEGFFCIDDSISLCKYAKRLHICTKKLLSVPKYQRIADRLTLPPPPAGPKRVPYNLADFVY